MTLLLLWYLFDDHLAQALDKPGLGHMEWWVILLIGLVLEGIGGGAAARQN